MKPSVSDMRVTNCEIDMPSCNDRNKNVTSNETSSFVMFHSGSGSEGHTKNKGLQTVSFRGVNSVSVVCGKPCNNLQRNGHEEVEKEDVPEAEISTVKPAVQI